ncbi:hypothetical protein HZH68_015447 [Vespula germanica]|uniref:Reverse transcriptase domain-containing protein n=1 Tax=Vespula germanica TaxID=30212 RepID=A0A834J5X1_VESGE|nr:hypothetical protein HZH68_015447 [Vespula germanica]
MIEKLINLIEQQIHQMTMVRALQELNSDYVPLLMYHSNEPQLTDASMLTIGKTNWEEFKKKLNKQINCNMRFKSTEDIEKAMKKLTKIIQTTATLTLTTTKDNHTKTATQQAQQKADQEAQHNKFETYMTSRGTMKETKAITYGEQLKTLKGQRGKNLFNEITQAKSAQDKATTFAEHLYKTFQINNTDCSPPNDIITTFSAETNTKELQDIKFTTAKKVNSIISDINIKKTSGFDLIKERIIKELRQKAIRIISEIYMIKAGVPQGSVLEPTLYTLYMANIPTTPNTPLFKFANNTVILAI